MRPRPRVVKPIALPGAHSPNDVFNPAKLDAPAFCATLRLSGESAKPAELSGGSNMEWNDSAAHAIAAESYDGVNSLFQAQGLAEPTFAWDPRADQIEPDILQQLLAYWHDLRGDRVFPDPKEIDPFDFKFALGYIMLLDVIDQGADFRYRLYGTKIALAYNKDRQDLRTSVFEGVIREFFTAVYRAVLIRRIPIFTEHEPPPNVYVSSWRRLILPYGANQDRIERFMVGNVPKNPARLARDKEA